MAKHVLREFSALRDALADFKARCSAWENEWSADVERYRDRSEKAVAELEAVTVSHGKQVDQWELLQAVEKARAGYQLPPESEYLVRKLRDMYQYMAALVDGELRAKAQLIAARERLRAEEEAHRALRSKWEKLRQLADQQGAGWLPPKLAELLAAPLGAAPPPRGAGVEMGHFEAAVARCEEAAEALAREPLSAITVAEPEAEMETTGETSTSRNMRELRSERMRVQMLEAEVADLRDREKQRQEAERAYQWLSGRVELLEAQLRETRGAADVLALPPAHEAMSVVDARERQLLKLKVAELAGQLDALRLRRWPGGTAVAPRSSWPPSEWVHLADLLEEFSGALDEQPEKSDLLASRTRELARLCGLAAKAVTTPHSHDALLRDALEDTRRELQQARRRASEARVALLAKPKPPKLVLSHMDCCLRAEELEIALKQAQTAVPPVVQSRAAALDGSESLEDYIVRVESLELKLDHLNHDNERLREQVESEHAVTQGLRNKNRELNREASEARAQLTVSIGAKDQEIQHYIDRIRAAEMERDDLREKERRRQDRRALAMAEDPLGSSHTSNSSRDVLSRTRALLADVPG